MCVCACVNGRVTHVHIYMHVEARRQLQVLLLRIQLLCFLRKKFSLGSGDQHLAISIVWLANEFLGSICPCLQVLGLYVLIIIPEILCGFQGLHTYRHLSSLVPPVFFFQLPYIQSLLSVQGADRNVTHKKQSCRNTSVQII